MSGGYSGWHRNIHCNVVKAYRDLSQCCHAAKLFYRLFGCIAAICLSMGISDSLTAFDNDALLLFKLNSPVQYTLHFAGQLNVKV